MSGDFTSDQKRYLEGFVAGAQAMRGATPGVATPQPAAPPLTGPDAAAYAAQDAVLAAGKRLVDQEKWKRAGHPFDAYGRLKAQARAGAFPKPDDNFRWRYFGLFYVAPAQSSYMLRLRIPGGILSHGQLAGLADLAERHGGGYAHVTTRANFQIREIAPGDAPAVVEAVQDLGLASRGAGADNIRNVTGSATAGIDPQELYDTRPLAREWHFHVLNDRSLSGLPRKFNVAFDGGGCIATLEETNDIGFQAVEIAAGFGVEPGVWFRVLIGGITGHGDLARDVGAICQPEDCTAIADAILRVFVENGDRTDRTKARLKYVLDAWGFEKFLTAVEAKLGRPLTRVAPAAIAARPPVDRAAHIGVHPQAQEGFNWIGVALTVGRMSVEEMRSVARVARELGDGNVRLTVWQNLILSGVADDRIEAAKAAIEAIGFDWRANALRAGLIACTGSTGCKFAAAHTKEHAVEIAAALEARLSLDAPINIHLTGCHHSCAQHYIGDIGLLAAKINRGEDEEPLEGYSIVVGGGFAERASIGRELWRDVPFEECTGKIEGLLRAYIAHRAAPEESFHAFANRHTPDALKQLAEAR